MFVSKKKFNILEKEYDELYEDYFNERAASDALESLLKKVYDSGHLKSRVLMKEIEGVIQHDES